MLIPQIFTKPRDQSLLCCFEAVQQQIFCLRRSKHILDSTQVLVAIDLINANKVLHKMPALCCACVWCHGILVVPFVCDLVQHPLSTKLRGRQADCRVLLLHWSTGTTQCIEIESTYGMHIVFCYRCVYWDNFVDTLGIFVLFVRVS